MYVSCQRCAKTLRQGMLIFKWAQVYLFARRARVTRIYTQLRILQKQCGTQKKRYLATRWVLRYGPDLKGANCQRGNCNEILVEFLKKIVIEWNMVCKRCFDQITWKCWHNSKTMAWPRNRGGYTTVVSCVQKPTVCDGLQKWLWPWQWTQNWS